MFFSESISKKLDPFGHYVVQEDTSDRNVQTAADKGKWYNSIHKRDETKGFYQFGIWIDFGEIATHYIGEENDTHYYIYWISSKRDMYLFPKPTKIKGGPVANDWATPIRINSIGLLDQNHCQILLGLRINTSRRTFNIKNDKVEKMLENVAKYIDDKRVNISY